MTTRHDPEPGLRHAAQHIPNEAFPDAIERQPIPIDRPIVVTVKGIRLCRPFEAALDLLDASLAGNCVKEDGGRVAAHPAPRRTAP